ncbi:hypothetical protein ACFE04_013132 [Oxalis oulophora]
MEEENYIIWMTKLLLLSYIVSDVWWMSIFRLTKEEKGTGRENIESEAHTDKNTFHGKDEKDYQGRSWISPFKETKANNDHCYIPNRLVHTWSGHTMGVSAVRFFPNYGHLILSSDAMSCFKKCL